MSRGKSSVGATAFSVIAMVGALVLFCLFFTAFLLVPFFIFIGGGLALLVSERNSKARADARPALPEKTGGQR